MTEFEHGEGGDRQQQQRSAAGKAEHGGAAAGVLPIRAGEIDEQQRQRAQAHQDRGEHEGQIALDPGIGHQERPGGEAQRQHGAVDRRHPAARLGRGEAEDPGLAQRVEGAAGGTEQEPGHEPDLDRGKQRKAEQHRDDGNDGGERQALAAPMAGKPGNERPGGDDAERTHGGVEPDHRRIDVAGLENDVEQRIGEAEADVGHDDGGDGGDEVLERAAPRGPARRAAHTHFTRGGSEESTASTFPPVLRPNKVPRS